MGGAFLSCGDTEGFDKLKDGEIFGFKSSQISEDDTTAASAEQANPKSTTGR